MAPTRLNFLSFTHFPFFISAQVLTLSCDGGNDVVSSPQRTTKPGCWGQEAALTSGRALSGAKIWWTETDMGLLSIDVVSPFLESHITEMDRAWSGYLPWGSKQPEFPSILYKILDWNSGCLLRSEELPAEVFRIGCCGVWEWEWLYCAYLVIGQLNWGV